MLKGILYALIACFIWGLIFIIPQFMEGYSSLEIALGRYLFYGLISSLIFFKSRLSGACRYPRQIWMKALGFSLAPTMGYYIFLVLSLRYATPAICALILGIAPITIAFYGNWKSKETAYTNLITPSILILVGLIVINVPQLMETTSPSTYLLGLMYAVLALGSWTWYVVANSRFLKTNLRVSSNDWATLNGIATLFWVLILGIYLIGFSDGSLLIKYTTFDPAMKHFLIGTAILGTLCSWVGGSLWNRASFHLPVSLAGQLMIFETLFGLLFVYVGEYRLPNFSESLGTVFLLGGVLYGIRSFSKTSKAFHPG